MEKKKKLTEKRKGETRFKNRYIAYSQDLVFFCLICLIQFDTNYYYMLV